MLAGVVSSTEEGEVAKRKPTWGLTLFDRETACEWASWPTESFELLKILSFLQDMERLTWLEIRSQMTGGNQRRGKKHKPIPVEDLIAEAQARLLELKLDDFDEVFRFRLGNMERLWGVIPVDHHIFYPVWWDRDHKVCPSADR